jgi:hypothetical protein
MLADLARRVRTSGVDFCLAEAHWRVRDLLAEERLGPMLGDLSRSYTVADLVDGASVESAGTRAGSSPSPREPSSPP